MRPVVVTVGPLATADADGICQSQTPAASLTINGALASGGVATMDTPRRVLVTTTADETGKTMTLTGTTFDYQTVTDVLALPNNSTVASVVDFKTITAATISAAAAGAMTVGTNDTAGSQWAGVDGYADGNIAIQVNVSGTVNYTVQQTLDDPNTGSPSVYQTTWVNSADTNVVSATATKQSNYLFPPRYIRVFLNSQTNPGYVTMRVIQAGGMV